MGLRGYESKALYPELYSSLNTVSTTNYGNSIPDQNGIIRERQCKALVNFFVNRILGKSFLRDDTTIYNNWSEWDDDNSDCVADYDYILGIGEGDLIYHSQYEGAFGDACDSDDYFYDPDTNQVSRTGNEDLSDYVKKGDIFIQPINIAIDYGHYGIIFDRNNDIVLDSNVCFPGRICKASFGAGIRSVQEWKVVRPN